MVKTTVVKTKDETNKLLEALKHIKDLEVYVGIPESNAARKKGDELTNAQLVFIHTNGVRTMNARTEIDRDRKEKGITYSQALQLYIQSNGSAVYSIPARPIIEPAIEAKGNKEAIVKELKEAMKASLDRKPEQAKAHLELAGMLGQNFARAWFTDPRNGWEPNSERTIKLKGSDRPLIDTGEMRKSIIYVVK